MQTKTTLGENIAIYGLLMLIIVAMAGSGCNAEPVGDDSIRLRAFLEVTYPGDSWSVSDYPPAVKVTNVGPEAANVSVFRFTLVADDDVYMEMPENCTLMYEDDPGEMVLIVSCTGISLEQDEILTMDFPITGPWHYLELTSIYSVIEDGDNVFNDISAAQPLMWFNQNY
jgi:hypothetical protein